MTRQFKWHEWREYGKRVITNRLQRQPRRFHYPYGSAIYGPLRQSPTGYTGHEIAASYHPLFITHFSPFYSLDLLRPLRALPLNLPSRHGFFFFFLSFTSLLISRRSLKFEFFEFSYRFFHLSRSEYIR